MQITLKSAPVFYDKKKTGEALTYIDKKTGKQKSYKKVKIEVVEKDRPLWGAVFSPDSPIMNWKGGEMVDIEITESGEYLNFELPKKGAFNFGPRIVNIEERLARVEEWIEMHDAMGQGTQEQHELRSEDLPF
jgi:hypothetical protein